MWEQMALIEYFRSYHEVCDPLVQVHDELLVEVGSNIVSEFAAMSQAIMTSCVPLEVPVLASGDSSEDWGSIK
jgi:DNA polymerase I-like protein with 3'-5' exonuclease and polymerase domains